PDDKEENEDLWAGRPRPWGWAVAGRAKPGAVALAHVGAAGEEKVPVSGRERRRAVVVRHNYGFGRVLRRGVGSSSTWGHQDGDGRWGCGTRTGSGGCWWWGWTAPGAGATRRATSTTTASGARPSAGRRPTSRWWWATTTCASARPSRSTAPARRWRWWCASTT